MLFFALFLILFHTEFHDLFQKGIREGLIQWKFQISFWACIRRNRFLQLRITGDGRKYSDVIFERCKPDQNLVLPKRWHVVANDFAGVGRIFADRLSDFFKNGLNLWRECCNVFVYALGLHENLTGYHNAFETRQPVPF